jgi:hypothetical protein
LSSEANKRDTERILILGDLKGEIPLVIDSLTDAGQPVSRSQGTGRTFPISDVDQEIVTYRSGLEFVEPSELVRAVIEEFLETIKATRSGV